VALREDDPDYDARQTDTAVDMRSATRELRKESVNTGL